MTPAPHCRLADIGRHVGQEVAVSCWLFNLRSKGRIHFLQLRDGSARVQAPATTLRLPPWAASRWKRA